MANIISTGDRTDMREFAATQAKLVEDVELLLQYVQEFKGTILISKYRYCYTE